MIGLENLATAKPVQVFADAYVLRNMCGAARRWSRVRATRAMASRSLQSSALYRA
jgi:hypothetical protein